MGVRAEQSIWRITRIQPPFSNHKLDHFGHVNFANVHLSPSCWDVQTVGCKVLCACGAQNLKRLILLWTHQSWYKGGQNAFPRAFPEVGICLHSSHGHVVTGCMRKNPIDRYISSMIYIYIDYIDPDSPWFDEVLRSRMFGSKTGVWTAARMLAPMSLENFLSSCWAEKPLVVPFLGFNSYEIQVAHNFMAMLQHVAVLCIQSHKVFHKYFTLWIPSKMELRCTDLFSVWRQSFHTWGSWICKNC